MASKKIPAEVLVFFREQGAKGGKLSAEARMRKLTPERRSEIARKAVAAREAKRMAAKNVAVRRKQIDGRPRNGPEPRTSSRAKLIMSKIHEAVSKPRERQLSPKEFFDKYAYLVDEPRLGRTDRNRARNASLAERLAERIPFKLAIYNLQLAGFVDLLRAGQAENRPDAVLATLEILLHRLGVEPLQLMIAPQVQLSKTGRPIASKSENIVSIWRQIGEPEPHKNNLAKAVYGSAFEEASGTTRRRMRDICRNAVYRHLDRQILKLTTMQAQQNKTLAELRRRQVISVF